MKEPIDSIILNLLSDGVSKETLLLETKFYKNDDKELYIEQTLTLYYAYSSVEIKLGNSLSPSFLRGAAKLLDDKLTEVTNGR